MRAHTHTHTPLQLQKQLRNRECYVDGYEHWRHTQSPLFTTTELLSSLLQFLAASFCPAVIPAVVAR